MLNNLKTYLGQGKFKINKVINFINNTLDSALQVSGTATIADLKLSIVNDVNENNGGVYGCCLETFEFIPDNFSILDFTIEGVKTDGLTTFDFSLSEAYGMTSGPTQNYLSFCNAMAAVVQLGEIAYEKSLVYDISTDHARVRNITFRINKNDNSIQLLEDEQILSKLNIGSDLLKFPDKKMHFKFKTKAPAGVENINTECYQVKINLFA